MRNIKVIASGFIFGFISTFIATLGLVIRAIEVMKPILVPGKYIWNFLNLPPSIILLAMINAIFYSLVFWVVYKVFKITSNNPSSNIVH